MTDAKCPTGRSLGASHWDSSPDFGKYTNEASGLSAAGRCPNDESSGTVCPAGTMRDTGTPGTLGTGGTPGTARRRLPDRRAHETITFRHEGQQFLGGVGRFSDGAIAELFINGSKFGSAAEASAQEAALVASMALQHGCPLDTIKHALTAKGVAGGPLGALLLNLPSEAPE